jgi:hypothetical protein
VSGGGGKHRKKEMIFNLKEPWEDYSMLFTLRKI